METLTYALGFLEKKNATGQDIQALPALLCGGVALQMAWKSLSQSQSKDST